VGSMAWQLIGLAGFSAFRWDSQLL